MGLILVIHVLLMVFSLLGFVAFGLLCNGFDLILVFFSLRFCYVGNGNFFSFCYDGFSLLVYFL